MCGFVCVRSHVWTYIWRAEITSGVLWECPLLRESLTGSRNLPIDQGWPAREAKEAACLCLPSTGLTGTSGFHAEVVGDWVQILMFVWQVFDWLHHIFSRKYDFFACWEVNKPSQSTYSSSHIFVKILWWVHLWPTFLVIFRYPEYHC